MSETVTKSQALEFDNPILTGPIWRQLLYFFFPILFGTFFQQLYNTVDAIIVGNFVGTAALAAVGGSTNVLISFLVNLFVGVASGATVIIAQQYGAGRYDKVHDTVHTAMAFTLASGVVIMVLGFVLSRPALQMMNTPAEIVPYGVTYMRIYFLGSVPSFIYNMGSGVLRAVGDTRRPLFFLIAACITNIVLDLVFVVGLGLGVAGVGFATILSQLVSAILVLYSLLHTSAPHRVEPKEIQLHFEQLKAILRVGIPAGIQSNMYTIANMLLQASVNAFGTLAVAAWTAEGKVDSFFWMVIGAFGISITTFVSQNFGAGQYERVRKAVRICAAMCAAVSALIALLFYVFSDPLLGLFTKDPEVIALGRRVLEIFCPFLATYVGVEVLSGAIRGCGEAMVPLVMTSLGICAFRVLWVIFILPMNHTFEMINYSYPISWVLTSLLFLVYYMKGNWLKKCIARQQQAAEAASAAAN